MAGGDAGRRGGDAVVAEHHRRRRGRAPRLAAAAPLRVVPGVHHLGERRDGEDRADAPGRAPRWAAARSRRREATAPTRSRLTGRLDPRGRMRVTRTCHDVIEPAAYQVSTLTRPRSSACPEYVVRATGRPVRDQSAIVSQVPVDPVGGHGAHLDADQALAGRGGLPRRDERGRSEARGRPRGRPGAGLVATAGDRARPRVQQRHLAAAELEPAAGAGLEVGVRAPRHEGDLGCRADARLGVRRARGRSGGEGAEDEREQEERGGAASEHPTTVPR